MTTAAAYTVDIPSAPHGFAKRVAAKSLEHAAMVYAAARDASGEGASTFRFGSVTAPDGEKFVISYNAKVWTGSGCDTGRCVYDPADHPHRANIAIPVGSLGVDAAKEAVNKPRKRDAQVAMASLIAKHGHKYSAEARQWCADFVAQDAKP